MCYTQTMPLGTPWESYTNAIRDQIRVGILTEEEEWQLRRERAMIRVENADLLTAAKYFLSKSSVGFGN